MIFEWVSCDNFSFDEVILSGCCSLRMVAFKRSKIT